MVVGTAAQLPRVRLDVRVVVPPTAFTGSDDQTHLAYELIVTGLSGANGARFERVEVFGDSDSKPLISYASSDLDERVMRPDADLKVRYGRLISSGTTALIHVWITLAKDQAVPRTLRHSFAVSAEDGSAVFAGEARVAVRSAMPLIIGPPLRGAAWLVHNGPGQAATTWEPIGFWRLDCRTNARMGTSSNATVSVVSPEWLPRTHDRVGQRRPPRQRRRAFL
jgi:hypothetical protein